MICVIHNLDRVTTFKHFNSSYFPKYFQRAESSV